MKYSWTSLRWWYRYCQTNGRWEQKKKSSKNKPPSVVAQWTSLRNPSFLKRKWVRERKEGKTGKVQQRRQQQQKRVERERKEREWRRRERERVRERKGKRKRKKVVVREWMNGNDQPQRERQPERERERENRVGNGFGYFGNRDRLILHSSVCIQYTCIRRMVGFIGWCLTVHAHFRLFTGMQLCTPYCCHYTTLKPRLLIGGDWCGSPDWLGGPRIATPLFVTHSQHFCCLKSIIQPINCVSGYSQCNFFFHF